MLLIIEKKHSIKLKSSVSDSKKNIRQNLRDEVVKVPIGSFRVFFFSNISTIIYPVSGKPTLYNFLWSSKNARV